MNFKSLEIDLEHKVRKIQPLYEVIHINPSVEEKIICILKYREYEDCYYAMLQIRVEPLVIKTLENSSLDKEIKEVDGGTNNCFQVSVDKFNKIVRFGPIGNIMITPDELLGLGIGSYAFNKLIGWLKGKCPDFDVHNIEIAEVDAEIDSDKNRRNQFYTHHGFTPKYNDPTTEKSGYFCIEKVDRLKIHDIKNIEVKNIYEIMKNNLELITKLSKDNDKLLLDTDFWEKEVNILANTNMKLEVWRIVLIIAVSSLLYKLLQ